MLTNFAKNELPLNIRVKTCFQTEVSLEENLRNLLFEYTRNFPNNKLRFHVEDENQCRELCGYQTFTLKQQKLLRKAFNFKLHVY